MGKIWFNGSMLFWWSLLFISSFPLILGNRGGGGGDEGLPLLVAGWRSHVNEEAIIETFEFTGDVIDCVDIYKQPALDHPLLKNHTIRMEPTGYPRIPKKWRAENYINVSTVEDPKPWILPRSCPKGSIPIPRMGCVQRRIKDMLPRSSTHEYAHFAVTTGKLYGARAIVNLQNPRVERRDEFSLAKIKVTSISGRTSLEVGWTVYPTVYGDYRTRLYTLWTNDDYYTSCYNLQCSVFVRINENIKLGMPLEPTSTFGGPQHDIELEIFQDRITKDWWIKVQGARLGYWPRHLVPQLRDGAKIHSFGGEVINKAVGRHTTTQMGSGHFSGQGYRKSAYFRNVMVVTSQYTSPEGGGVVTSHPRCYNVNIGQTRDQPQWGHYFFYGGPGKSESCL